MYARYLVEHPIKTKALTSFILSALSSLLAQVTNERTNGHRRYCYCYRYHVSPAPR